MSCDGVCYLRSQNRMKTNSDASQSRTIGEYIVASEDRECRSLRDYRKVSILNRDALLIDMSVTTEFSNNAVILDLNITNS